MKPQGKAQAKGDGNGAGQGAHWYHQTTERPMAMMLTPALSKGVYAEYIFIKTHFLIFCFKSYIQQ